MASGYYEYRWKKYDLKTSETKYKEIGLGFGTVRHTSAVQKIVGIGIMQYNGEKTPYYAGVMGSDDLSGMEEKLMEYREIPGWIVPYNNGSLPAQVKYFSYGQYRQYGKANFRIVGKSGSYSYKDSSGNYISGTETSGEVYLLVFDKEKNRYITDVVSIHENEYPKNDQSGDYWYEYVGSQWISTNQDPVISTSATQLGVQSQDFKISYSVSDPDNNPVTVEVYRDGTKTPQSPFVAVSGQSYSEQFTLSQFEIGNHTMVVKATDSEGGTVTKTWNWTRANANPTISGSDEDLGNQNSGFSIAFTVDDIDASDELNATVMLNEKLLKTINNVKRKTEQTVTISDGEVFALEIGKLNTITIKVDDGKGGVSYRYKYFKRSNTAPKLSGEPEINLGSLTAPKEISFTATDAEKDKMTYSIYLNDKEILSNQELTDGEAKKFTLSKLQFSKLDNVNTHILKVVVTDAQKATAVQTFKFKRSLTSCWYQVKKETDARAGSMYVYTNITLADGAKLKVLVCNNAFDAAPTWEDMTQVHNQRGTYQIKNMTKTAAKWGIGLKVEILPGTSKEPSWINGIGGAFK